MRNLFLLVAFTVLITIVIGLAAAPQSASTGIAEAVSTATAGPTWTPVPPTSSPAPTPRVVKFFWVLTHSDYPLHGTGAGRCPMPKNKSLLATEKPEIKFDSGTVLVEIVGESYWLEMWELGLDYQPQLSAAVSGTVYIQPSDCTVTISPAEYSLEIP